MKIERDDTLIPVIAVGLFIFVFTAIDSINDATKLDCTVKMARIHSDWGFEELQQACGIKLSATKEGCVSRLSRIHSDWRVEELRQVC